MRSKSESKAVEGALHGERAVELGDIIGRPGRVACEALASAVDAGGPLEQVECRCVTLCPCTSASFARRRASSFETPRMVSCFVMTS